MNFAELTFKQQLLICILSALLIVVVIWQQTHNYQQKKKARIRYLRQNEKEEILRRMNSLLPKGYAIAHILNQFSKEVGKERYSALKKLNDQGLDEITIEDNGKIKYRYIYINGRWDHAIEHYPNAS